MPSLPGLVCVDDKLGFDDKTHIHTRIEDVKDEGPCVEARRLPASQ